MKKTPEEPMPSLAEIEAEVMAEAGIRDVLIANMIVGPRKLERVVSLCRSADPIITCDHYTQVEPLAADGKPLPSTGKFPTSGSGASLSW